ncbi:hypothetical protein F5146DRAFT_1125584 [Armillaria mellea]|nr:hypothetical protein F5146DRAFT_1125584 [Armillaria mellea]
MCMTALQSISAKTTPACRKIVESICSSRCSQKPIVQGKVRPGILCPPPDGESGNRPWLYLMGTFDGEDENPLPQVYKELSVVVATGPSTEEGKFVIRTVPEWQTSSPDKTQFLVTVPSTPPSGTFPTEVAIELRDEEIKAMRLNNPTNSEMGRARSIRNAWLKRKSVPFFNSDLKRSTCTAVITSGT